MWSALLAGLLLPVGLAGLALSASWQSAPITASKTSNIAAKRAASLRSIPQVEPVILKNVKPPDARALNASIPFSTASNPPARPFNFHGTLENRARALDCLAAAVLYEAGDNSTGQRAVAQVVLNRVRHPAFPKSVCGVVFQGSERQTGCQFTFTCDGALNRAYAEPLWRRARVVADAALSGTVYNPVGQATHYHTDWVVPYWSSSLEKIVAVDTHIFFRWAGWWGTPPAFRFSPTGIEPHISKLAARFPEHDTSSLLAPINETSGEGGALAGEAASATLKPSVDDPNVFISVLAKKDSEKFPTIARRACGTRAYCKFRGWTDPRMVPHDSSSELRPEQLDAVSFSFLRDPAISFERTLWNCAQFKHPAENCMWNASAGLRPLKTARQLSKHQ
ncbi:cell wall hydrolase [Novosphingobium sp. 9U]|uniref:cell wall hydrolase n=1 Tax=Novosphingobium sp. 9U TaxID=2653158 RepID=UPI00210FB6DF|nr:cell wall hydrolase [Novosphingobium sp. 9U]